jgi:CubicO group peptidase (beta-lactamase class C family)
MGSATFARRRLLKSIAGIGGLAVTPSSGRARLSGVEAEPWVTHLDLDATDFRERHAQYAGAGYRLTDVSGYAGGTTPRYAAVWTDADGPTQRVRVGLSSRDFQSESSAAAADGFRLTSLSGYAASGSARFAAIWEASQDDRADWYGYTDLTPGALQSHLDWCATNDYWPADVSGYTVDGAERYAAVWERAATPGWYCDYRLTPDDYAERLAQYLDEQYRLKLLCGYTVDGRPHYVGVWEERPGSGWYVNRGLTAETFEDRSRWFENNDFRPKALCGYVVDSVPRFSCVWDRPSETESPVGKPLDFTRLDAAIKAYMQQHQIPGTSLAITKDERLVFAKGYGRTDSQGTEPVTPRHRFRIASISKSITAVAIMRLVEQGDLALTRPVFGPAGILGTTYGTPTHRGDWETSLTVGHLLRHTSGWNFEYDPAFAHRELDRDALIDLLVDTHEITYEPGTRYSYSNFGYVILEAVLERVSGTEYEPFVADTILDACGIDGMEIGARTREKRESREVVYHSADDTTAYTVPLERAAGAFGWIAAPVDLLQFVVRVDRFTAKADVLSPSTTAELYDREGVNRDYGEGWMLRSDWCGHNGTLPGSIAFLVRRDDGISFAVLGNRRAESDHYGFELRSAIDEAITKIDRWPSHDRF